jgi:hypothetical protein
MKDLKREILNQVAAGTISAEDGAARLDSLESVESANPAGASRLLGHDSTRCSPRSASTAPQARLRRLASS